MKLTSSETTYPATLASGPPKPPLTIPDAPVETRNMTPRKASSPSPRARCLRKFGRSLNGTAHTVLSAFCAAEVTPSPPSSDVTIPITSAVTLPVSPWGCSELPMIGSWPTTECSTDFSALGVAVQHEPQDRREHQQQREQREERRNRR